MQLHKSGCQSQVKKRNFFISKLTCPFKILEEKEKLLFWLLKPFSNFGIYQKLFANFVLGITFMLTAQSQTSHCILRCNKVPCIAFMIELIHGDVFILGHNHMEINKCRTKGQPNRTFCTDWWHVFLFCQSVSDKYHLLLHSESHGCTRQKAYRLLTRVVSDWTKAQKYWRRKIRITILSNYRSCSLFIC